VKQFNQLFRVFFPLNCSLCKIAVKEAIPLCPTCCETIFSVTKHHDLTSTYSASAIPHILSCGDYENELQSLIQQWKFMDQKGLTAVFRSMLLRSIPPAWPPFDHNPTLVTVPSVPKGKSKSNHLQMLGQQLAADWALPIYDDIIIREPSAHSQVGQSREERFAEAKHKFRLKNLHDVKQILIFDDIITTGATVSALTSLFKEQGVQVVGVIVIAGKRFRK
jgi:ComF family protein